MKLKKVLALVLCVAMVLGTMSTVVFAADENVAKIGGTEYATLADALASVGTGDIEIDLLADAVLDVTAWDTLAIGNDTATTITINGNENTLTFNQLNSDWNNIATKNNAKLVLNNMTISNSGYNNGPWNRYDINFACDVELNKVTATKAMAFKANAKLNNVIINEEGDNYAIWITANGQKVEIDGLTINSAGRGIKIDEQYIDSPIEVKLTVENATFTTAKKAAIVVKSEAGAEITANNVDITGVAADTVNAAWNDTDSAASFHKITVTGGTLAQEDASDFVAQIVDGGYYKSLADALAAAENSDIIELFGDVTLTDKVDITKSVTVKGDGEITLATGNMLTISAEGVTLKDMTIEGTIVNSGAEAVYVKGSNARFENVDFVNGGTATWGSNVEIVSDNGETTFVECTFTGAFRGVLVESCNEDVVFEKCIFRPIAYTVNYDGASGSLTAKECEFYGWTSYGIVTKSATFTDCYFGKGNYNVVAAYVDTKFESCDFSSEGLIIADQTSGNVDWTITDCTVDNEPVTQTELLSKCGNYDARIGDVFYSNFADAISAAVDGDDVVILAAGTYKVPTGKNISITGAVDDVKFDMSNAVGVNASMTFDNVTFEYGNANYVGLQHAGDMVYNNCTINGQVFLYGESETFNNCTFNQNSKDAYNVWTYGAKDVDFNGCTFNSDGKAVLVYNEGTDLVTNVTLTDSKLIASEKIVGKAAIEIDSSLSVNGNYTIEVNNTTATGFGTGSISGNSLWNDKKADINSRGGVVVEVDGEIVLAHVANNDAVAVVNGVAYATLQAAVDATNGNGTVVLVGNVEETVTVNAPIIATYSTEGVVIDLDGYTLKGNVVVESGATVEVKNGTIVNNNKDVSAIETVGTTTLTDLNVTSARHAVRVEGGITTINRGNYSVPGTTGTTTHVLNVSDGGKAIVNNSVFTGPAGTVSDSGSAVKVQANSTVEINGGKYVGGKLKTLSVDGTLVITTGTFDQDPTAYVVDTTKYNVVEGAGMWVVVEDKDVADEVYVQYRKTDVKPGTKTDNLEGSDTYEIVLSGNKEKINELASADLTFDFKGNPVGDGAMTYTVEPAYGVTLSQMGHRYMFNYNGKDLYEKSGEEIVIGTITIDGYGKYSLKTDGVTTNAVYATKIIDNIVDGYRPAAKLIINKDLNTADTLINEKFENVTIKVPTRRLTVNVTFPNSINDNEAAYQNMTVSIVGGNINKTIALGTDAADTDKEYKVTIKKSADGENASYVISANLPYNTAYTVTVSGAGYRTARYTVKLTENKTLNFWNNVMSNDKEIEVGEASSKTTTTFLAGDIVKDNNINIYDLSAVVSYFGTEGLSEAYKPEYAKYDLNRDGVIDSKDVAYVLVSWGE